MKSIRWLAFAILLFFPACQPPILPAFIIIDSDKIITLQTGERVPSALLNQAGLTLNPNDRLLLNGLPHRLDQEITNPLTISGQPTLITLQVRRAANVLIITQEGQQ